MSVTTNQHIGEGPGSFDGSGKPSSLNRESSTSPDRLARLQSLGLSEPEALSARLAHRDRDLDDCEHSFECKHIAGHARSAWRCNNWQAACVAIRASDARRPAALVTLLQRGDCFDDLIPNPETLKVNAMTKGKAKTCRTCGNCYQYIPKRTPEGFIGCGNDFERITAVDPVTGQITASRPVVATDVACDDHMTNEEYDEYWAGLDQEDRDRAEGFFEALKEMVQEDLKREKAERDQLHQAETSADRLTMQLLGKLRKGDAS